MGDIQTAGEADRHRHGGNTGALDQGLTDGVQDNETAVAEDGDGNHPAHQLDGQLGILFTHQFDHQVSQLQGGTGLFKHRADEGAEDNDNTNGGEGSGEARTDDARNILQRNTGNNGEQQRNAHDRQERMNLQLGDEKDHQDDRDDKRDDKRKTGHKKPSLLNMELSPTIQYHMQCSTAKTECQRNCIFFVFHR